MNKQQELAEAQAWLEEMKAVSDDVEWLKNLSGEQLLSVYHLYQRRQQGFHGFLVAQQHGVSLADVLA